MKLLALGKEGELVEDLRKMLGLLVIEINGGAVASKETT